jgi:multidrug efflux pump subunit AcrA (membrane-fusion protein)
MNKWLVLILVIVLVGVGWYIARQQEFEPAWAQPKFGEVTRGDIRVPITAAGLIHADQVIEVKPEASGEVTEVRAVEGMFVEKGETLVVLDPNDEQRIVDQREADLERAQALLTQAKVAVMRAEVNIHAAEVRRREVASQGAMAEYDWRKIEATIGDDGNSPLYSDQQIHNARSQHELMQAQIESADVGIETAKLTLQDAQANVRSQQAIVRSAERELETARDRLSETTVLASKNGIVTQVFVEPGMLVQSGTQSLTGGTPLLRMADVSKKKVVARLGEADYGRVLDVSPVDALPDMPGLRDAAKSDAETIAHRSGAVRITVDAFPDEDFTGRIERVEPQGKLNAGSSIIQFDVHVEITDEQRNMLPLGAQAQVEFTVESASDVLRVPAEAVKSFEAQRGVWLRTEPEPGEKHGKKFLPCRFGISDGEFTQVIEVLGGGALEPGQRVYTRLPTDVDDNR